MDRIGRYKIVRELGRGAMGVVYHAIDPNIGRPVAIKTIQLSGARKPEEQERLRERLFREARSAGMLSHPGIVTIYDVEQQGEVAYIAMEYVDGPTLDQLLSDQPPLAPDKLFSILAQTAAALDYAHQKGIVHRDIKPANIMIARDGTTKITDFGIAKFTASDQLTMTGSIVGTPHYMSPEQVQGHTVDGRSDQFSLAVIAYEALTGEKPYTGEHLTTVVYKIVTEEPVALRRLNPSLGGAIEGAVAKALAKKPDARYRNCQEFVDTLEKACAASKGWKLMPRGGSLNEPTVAEPPTLKKPPAVTLPKAVRPQRLGDTTVTSQRSGGKKGGLLTFLLAVLVAGGLLALIGLQGGSWLGTSKQPPTEEAKAVKPPEVPQTAQPAQTAPTTPQPAAPAPAEARPPEPKSEQPPVEPPVRKPAEAPARKPESAAARTDKPSALSPSASQPAHRAPERAPERAAEAVQAVTVISSPAGASATLDGRPDAVCTTPCTLDAAPGRHNISLVLGGYQVERREFDVGSGPLELPAVVLRAPGGTLMLSSVPGGANVLINGRAIGKTTPAQIQLPLGSYKVTVEHEGRQATHTVDVRNGISYLKITLP
jgi:serine/threonine protein kinase